MIEIKYEDSQRIKRFFQEPKYHMTKAYFDGKLGKAFVNNLDNISWACVIVKTFCFINGNITQNEFEQIIKVLPKEVKIFNTSYKVEKMVTEYFKENFEIYTRYVMNNPNIFDLNKLEDNINKLDSVYKLKLMNNPNILEKVFKSNEYCTNLGMTEDYLKNGLGVCCFKDDRIVGIITSNIVYNNGIELNIKVNPDERRKGIATAISSKIILECLKRNLIPYWDAANTNSLGLATKLGYIRKCDYNVYLVKR